MFGISVLTAIHLTLIGVLVVQSQTSTPNKLLLILIDGFRWDYIDNFADVELPGFTRLRQNGVTAGGLVPVFPTLSYSNYYSIMTGQVTLFSY